MAARCKPLTSFDKSKRRQSLSDFAQLVEAQVDTLAEARDTESPLDTPTTTHNLTRMPQTGSLLFGRRNELKLLDKAWDSGTNIVAFTAGGGVGKSTLARVWAEMLAEDKWRGAERAFAWSFYSQGTGRMTDADSFIDEALRWFGDETPEKGSPWDKGERLAALIRKRRTLLLLDGVEPLQSGEEGVDKGSIRDPGLRTLLEELAIENTGLCVVTTREELSDLHEFGAPQVLHENLDQVSTLAGRALLRVQRVKGEDKAIEAAVEDLGQHALAVSLLGRLLREGSEAPHISTAKQLIPPLVHKAEEGGHPRRVLEAWTKRLSDDEEELMHMVGLFDRPAEMKAVEAVLEGKGLAHLTTKLSRDNLDTVLGRLRSVGLIARASTQDDEIDTHPVVREHFGDRLKAKSEKSWKEGHRRLYAYYKSSAEHRPGDLKGMQPLFAAVMHGCAAGVYQETCEEVYRDRIKRGNEFYLVKKLGAIAADLSSLSHFFEETWMRPEPSLSAEYQSWVIGEAGFALRALGRLREAGEAMEEALRQYVAQEEWRNASISAGNLSELQVVLGVLEEGERYARDAVRYAGQSGDEFEQLTKRTALADALHQRGKRSEARALFEEAEAMQKEGQPHNPLLYSLQGYQYCDLLLAEGEVEDVLRRARQTLGISSSNKWLLDIALDQVSLGRAYMAGRELETAGEYLSKAVDGLRAAGHMQYLPLGLLPRASYHRLRQDYAAAQRDLDEARTLIRRAGLRLYEVDLALEACRLSLAMGDKKAAREQLAKAQAGIEAMGYDRHKEAAEELAAQIEG